MSHNVLVPLSRLPCPVLLPPSFLVCRLVPNFLSFLFYIAHFRRSDLGSFRTPKSPLYAVTFGMLALGPGSGRRAFFSSNIFWDFSTVRGQDWPGFERQFSCHFPIGVHFSYMKNGFAPLGIWSVIFFGTRSRPLFATTL